MAIISKKDNSVSYKGMVIRTYTLDEKVMSDVYAYFKYATVYDFMTDTISEICLGSDFSGYNFTAEADASKELVALYEAHKLREKRHGEAVALWNEHNENVLVAHKMGITLSQFKTLIKVYGRNTRNMNGVYHLLKTKKFRNEFRAKLAQQVRDWLVADVRQFKTPLSPKQLACVMPYESRYAYYYGRSDYYCFD